MGPIKERVLFGSLREIHREWIRAAVCGMVLLLSHAPAFGQTDPETPPRPDLKTMSLFQEVLEKLRADDYRGAIDLVESYFKDRSVSDENFILLHFKAQAHAHLKEWERAIASLEETLPLIRKMNNVMRRRFASVFFQLGGLYHQKGDTAKAIALLKEGLTLEPQNTYYQIVLGTYYADSGQK